MVLNSLFVNSTSGDYIRSFFDKEKEIVFYSLVTPYIRRILSESEFIHIRDNFGFLPIKEKKFRGHSFLKYSKVNPPIPVIYPTKQEIRDYKLNKILK